MNGRMNSAAGLAHCSKLEIVLNENDTPQNQLFLLQKSVDIQG